jgi:predicted transcriptional regulator YheO
MITNDIKDYETKCVTEWCETLAISPFTVYWWIREKGKEYAEQRLSEIA